ncbi:hypothetical protein HS7_20340 [Sulfolobales archaeon HS-7]|nr:hypothetical protein HS7_20340 [Sulfolobales archaeon HS-7]
MNWFAYEYEDRIRDLLLKVFRRLESRVNEEQLPPLPSEGEVRKAKVDSFPVEPPHGEKSVETHRNLYWISGKLIQGGNLMKYLRRSMRGKGINSFLSFPRNYTLGDIREAGERSEAEPGSEGSASPGSP